MAKRPAKKWIIAIAIFIVMATLTIIAWRQQVEYQHSLLSRHTEDVCVQASRRLEVFMESHLRVANIFARRWSTHEARDFSRQRFEKFASVLIEELPGFHAVRLIQPNQDLGWVIPGNIQIPKTLLDPEHRRKLEEALQIGQVVLSAPFEADLGNTSIYIALPLQREEEYLGYLVVDFLLETLINDCFHTRIRSEFYFMIQDEDLVLFRSDPEVAISYFAQASIRASETIPIRNRTWRLTMVPIVAKVSAFGWTANLPTLFLGLLLSIGLSWLVYLLMGRMDMFRAARDQQTLLSRKVLMAQEEERARVSRELHDELGQLLTALRLEMGWLEKRIPAKQEDETGVLHSAVFLVEEAAEELRRMCKGLRPPLLDDLGLEPAVRLLVGEIQGRADLDVRLDFSLDDKNSQVSKEIALCTYRILQESLTNISRHAQATKVSVKLITTPEELILSVIDNGVGFNVETLGAMQGWGLEGMQERANLVGGTFEIRSARDQGTRVLFRVPIRFAQKGETP